MTKTPLTGAPTSDDAPRPIPVAPRNSLPLGYILGGRYELLGQLGAGGMGLVFRAHDQKLHEDIALKVILPDRLEDPRAVERLQREVKLARRISHINVCRVFDFGESGGTHFLTMELIEGQSLRELLVEGALPLPKALDVLLQVARALSAAHAEGIVHRDLKPENVLLRPNGQVKVLDFGIARHAGQTPGGSAPGEADATTTVDGGGVIGTPLYMAPEQIHGGLLDGRTDQFAWGVLAHELLTGAPPWSREGTRVLTQILTEEPAQVRSIRPEVPEAVSAIVARALAKEPGDRFRSMDEVLAALEPLVAQAEPKGRIRRRTMALAAGAISIVAVAATTMALRPGAPASNSPPLPSASAAPSPTAVIDLPVPASAAPEAARAYRQALAQLRLAGGGAEPDLTRAATLDPSLAEAHLQLAAFCVYRINDSVRDHFRKAEELRASLSPRDQAFLDAIEPIVRRQPSDWREALRRLESSLDRYPRDAQLWYILGAAEMNKGEFEKAVGHLDRAAIEDPGYVEALAVRGHGLAYLGRFGEARAALEACQRASPRTGPCITFLAGVLVAEGDCRNLEDLSRHTIAGGELAAGYRFLAASLAALGSPAEAIREADERWQPLVPEWRRSEVAQTNRLHLAAWIGDFEGAERHAREHVQDSKPRPRQDAQGNALVRLVEILTETGRTAEAGRLAVDFLARKDALEPNPAAEDFAIIDDRTPEMLVAARQAGLLDRTEVSKRRAAWLSAWERRVEPFFRGYLWVKGYAAMAETVEDAREALEVLPRYAPIPRFSPTFLTGGAVGVVYTLAGKAEEALPWLEQATRACNGIWFPITHTHAHAWLGRAREAKGDVEGACVAYEAVLKRWGQAKPRSVTAEAARERRKTLRCGTR